MLKHVYMFSLSSLFLFVFFVPSATRLALRRLVCFRPDFTVGIPRDALQ